MSFFKEISDGFLDVAKKSVNTVTDAVGDLIELDARIEERAVRKAIGDAEIEQARAVLSNNSREMSTQTILLLFGGVILAGGIAIILTK